MDLAEPLPLSVFSCPNEDVDHRGCASAPAEHTAFLWSRLPQTNRTRLLQVLSRLLERRLQPVVSRPMEAISDESHELDVPKPVVDGRAVIGHAI